MMRNEAMVEYARDMWSRYRMTGSAKDALLELAAGHNVEGPPYQQLTYIFGTGSINSLTIVGRILQWEQEGFPSTMIVPVASCEGCGTKHLQITEFPQFPTTVQCADCVAGRKRVSAAVDSALRGVTSNAILPDFEEVLAKASDMLGGVDGLAEHYVTALSSESKLEGSKKVVLDHYRDFFKLLKTAGEKKDDIDSLTGERLADYVVDKLLIHRDVRDRVKKKLAEAEANEAKFKVFDGKKFTG